MERQQISSIVMMGLERGLYRCVKQVAWGWISDPRWRKHKLRGTVDIDSLTFGGVSVYPILGGAMRRTGSKHDDEIERI